MDSELDAIESHIDDITAATAAAAKSLKDARKELDELEEELHHVESKLDDADVEIAMYTRFIKQHEELWTAFRVAERIS